MLLALNNLGLQLVAGGLKLLNAAHALSFEAGLPQLDLSLGLGEGLQGVGLPHGFVLHLLPEVLEVGGHHLVLGQQRGTILAFSIGQGLGVLQLGGDRDLTLVHVGNGSLQFVNLAGQVLVLDLQPLLGRLGLIEGMGHLVEPGVGINDVALEQLATLVQISLALDSILEVATGIAEVQLHVSLVLLGLHLVAVEVVNLLSQVSHGVVVLHAKSSKGSLVSNVQLLKPRLQFLSLLGILGSKSGLVVNLSGKSTALLVLAGSGSLKLSLNTLQVSEGLLGQLQVSLNL